MRAPDVLSLLDHVVFNILACNTDAHAKNYSLMISGRGFSLAPIYDVMCAAAWDGVTRNLAQKIAGKNRGEHLKRRHWQAFAAECGLSAPRLIKRVEELANAVLREAKGAATEVDVMPAGTHVMMPPFVAAIETRARAIISGLNEIVDGPEPIAEMQQTRAPVTKKPRKKKVKAAAH
jgi:serine/threonine-protein kinase HipA